MWPFNKHDVRNDVIELYNDGVNHVQLCLSKLTDREFKSMSRADVIKLIGTMKG